MKIQEVREIAKRINVAVNSSRTKQDLIRDIQVTEGNSPCYKAIADCGITNCLWREDCLSKKK